MVKAVACHVFNHHLNQNVTMRIGFETIQGFESSNLCKACYLDGSISEVTDGAAIFSLLSDEIVSVCKACRMVTQTGTIYVKDMVFAPSHCQLLAPSAFLEVRFMSGALKFMIQGNAHRSMGNCLFEASPRNVLLPWEGDFHAVPYSTKSCGSIHACLHSLDRKILRLAQN